jgi:hypothetical protein
LHNVRCVVERKVHHRWVVAVYLQNKAMLLLGSGVALGNWRVPHFLRGR